MTPRSFQLIRWAAVAALVVFAVLMVTDQPADAPVRTPDHSNPVVYEEGS